VNALPVNCHPTVVAVDDRTSFKHDVNGPSVTKIRSCAVLCFTLLFLSFPFLEALCEWAGWWECSGRHTRSQRSNVTWQPTVVTVLEWSVGGEIILLLLLLIIIIIIIIIIHLLYGRKEGRQLMEKLLAT
jgi:hypothetical protein